MASPRRPCRPGSTASRSGRPTSDPATALRTRPRRPATRRRGGPGSRCTGARRCTRRSARTSRSRRRRTSRPRRRPVHRPGSGHRPARRRRRTSAVRTPLPCGRSGATADGPGRRRRRPARRAAWSGRTRSRPAVRPTAGSRCRSAVAPASPTPDRTRARCMPRGCATPAARPGTPRERRAPPARAGAGIGSLDLVAGRVEHAHGRSVHGRASHQQHGRGAGRVADLVHPQVAAHRCGRSRSAGRTPRDRSGDERDERRHEADPERTTAHHARILAPSGPAVDGYRPIGPRARPAGCARPAASSEGAVRGGRRPGLWPWWGRRRRPPGRPRRLPRAARRPRRR